MPVSRPVNTSAVVPIHSTPWPVPRVQKAYTIAAAYMNAVSSPNSRYSLFMGCPSGRATRGAVGVERFRRGGVRVRVARRAQRVRRAQPLLLGLDDAPVLVD